MLATVLWCAYLLIAFGAMSLYARLRYGRFPFVTLLDRPTRYNLIDAVYGLVTGGLAVTLILDPPQEPTAVVSAGGVVLFVAGLGLQIWAVLTLGRHWRIGQDESERRTQFVTRGPYRWVGHPIYVSLLVIAVSMCVLSAARSDAVAFGVLTVIYAAIQSRREDHYWRGRNAVDDA